MARRKGGTSGTGRPLGPIDIAVFSLVSLVIGAALVSMLTATTSLASSTAISAIDNSTNLDAWLIAKNGSSGIAIVANQQGTIFLMAIPFIVLILMLSVLSLVGFI